MGSRFGCFRLVISLVYIIIFHYYFIITSWLILITEWIIGVLIDIAINTCSEYKTYKRNQVMPLPLYNIRLQQAQIPNCLPNQDINNQNNQVQGILPIQEELQHQVIHPANQANNNIRSPVRLFHILCLVHLGTLLLFLFLNTILVVNILMQTLIRLENGLCAVTLILLSDRMLDFSSNALNRWMFQLLEWQYWPNKINRLSVYFDENEI